MNAELQRAVEDAYRVFARYDLGSGIEVCRCPVCVAPECERALNATPLRELSRDLLAEYTNSAHGWGSDKVAGDLRYLLPRYFELIAQQAYPCTLDPEHSLGRLHLDHYREIWPAAEIAAIDAFFLALFRDALLAPIEVGERNGLPIVRGASIRETLGLISGAGGDFSPLLAAWEGQDGRVADLRLADYVASLSTGAMEEWWAVPPLDPAAVARGLGEKYALDEERLGIDRETQRAIRWLARPEIRERLERACLAEPLPPAAALLSLAEQIVTALMVRA